MKSKKLMNDKCVECGEKIQRWKADDRYCVPCLEKLMQPDRIDMILAEK